MSESLRNQIIWDEFRKGSKVAPETIYGENYVSLYYYGLKFSKDNDLVKDLIHELFIELIDSGSRLSQTDNIRFYLLKAFRNKLFHQLSLNSKFSNKLEESTEFNLIDSIESQLIKKEVEEQLQNQIITAIKKLSVKQQEIIYLRFYREIVNSPILAFLVPDVFYSTYFRWYIIHLFIITWKHTCKGGIFINDENRFKI